MTDPARILEQTERGLAYAMKSAERPTWLARALAGLRMLGPYLAIELLLPGGSLVALLCGLYQLRRKALAAQAP